MRSVILVVAMLCGVAAHAREPVAMDNPGALARWFTFYYTHPDPERVPDALLAMSKAGTFKTASAVPPFIGFLAGWFAKNGGSAEGAIEKLAALPADEQPMLVLGLWYSMAPGAKALLTDHAGRLPAQQKKIAQLVTTVQVSATRIPLEEGPWVLDLLWGNFMATGDEAPVIRLMSALPWATIKGDIPRLLVGGSAKWSLTSNAVQHARVLEICRSQVSLQPEHIAAPLAEVIRNAEQQLRERKSEDAR